MSPALHPPRGWSVVLGDQLSQLACFYYNPTQTGKLTITVSHQLPEIPTSNKIASLISPHTLRSS